MCNIVSLGAYYHFNHEKHLVYSHVRVDDSPSSDSRVSVDCRKQCQGRSKSYRCGSC